MVHLRILTLDSLLLHLQLVNNANSFQPHPTMQYFPNPPVILPLPIHFPSLAPTQSTQAWTTAPAPPMTSFFLTLPNIPLAARIPSHIHRSHSLLPGSNPAYAWIPYAKCKLRLSPLSPHAPQPCTTPPPSADLPQ